MKRLFLILLALILLICITALVVWTQRASIAASMIHRHLGVPVTIESLELTKTNATISHLSIGNPPQFQSPTAFTARSIDITSSLAQIRANPLVIDEIVMDDLLINLDQKNGTTNWNQILAHHKNTPSNRHYLIKTLIFRNLSITVTTNGQVKNYTLPRMEFHNISDETGFPVNEIEKAIFDQMMKKFYQQFDIQKILQPLVPGGQYLPNLQNLFK